MDDSIGSLDIREEKQESYENSKKSIERIYAQWANAKEELQKINELENPESDSFIVSNENFSRIHIEIPAEYISDTFFVSRKRELRKIINEKEEQIKKIEELVECLSE